VTAGEPLPAVRSASDPITPTPASQPPPPVADDPPRGFSWIGALARGLGPLLRPHRGQMLLIGALMVVELGLQLGQRKAFSTLFDEAILKSQVDLMLLILALLGAAAVVSGIAGLLHEYLQARLCASVPGELRSRLYEHTQRLPLSNLRTASHGDLITRITNDAGSVEPALWALGYIAAALCGVVISCALLLWTDWQLALVGIALLPLALIGPRLLTPRAASASYEAKTAAGALATHLQENLANQIVLRVFGLARVASERFAAHNQRIIAASRRYNVLSYFSHRVPWIAMELIELTILAIGCWRVLDGQMSPGALIAFYLLFSGLASHTYTLTTSIPGLIGASAGMRRIGELLDQTAERGQAAARPAAPARPVVEKHAQAHSSAQATPGEGADASEASRLAGASAAPLAVGFERVSFRHASSDSPARPDSVSGGAAAESAVARAVPAARDTLREVTFSLVPGALNAFVGASGSGKSTALQLLLGLYAPRSGRILIDGRDLATLPLDRYRMWVSAVFQDSLLFNTTIAENIRAGRLDATDAQIERAAAAAGIAGWVATLPDGYATQVAGDTCSGGQRQRIAIARALVREPALLVLDEPTSALDPASAAAVAQTLRSVALRCTTLLITHQLRDAAFAQQIVVFDQGRVVETGTHGSLLAAGGSYAALWREQQGAAPGADAAP
jgi:ATP-binding cassette, subfamily B, bacterial